MRVFLAGASGAIGQALIPVLIGAGHGVFGTTRSEAKAPEIAAAGAEPVILDALDREAVIAAVRAAAPDVLIHQLTAVPDDLDLRHFDREFALTNRLRTEGTDHLLEAAEAAGVRQFIAQSYAGWTYAREGGLVKTEDDPLDPDPPPALRNALNAIRHLEAAVLNGARLVGTVLRYGTFYGPGNAFGPGGSMVEAVRRRHVPLVGEGNAVWSFVHIDDAASATVAAANRGAAGLYNIADDRPAPVREWLPGMAAVLGAKPPHHVPVWLARLTVGEHAVVFLNEARGASNAKAKRELQWTPAWPFWREGFAKALS